jgi:hypothetical protein
MGRRDTLVVQTNGFKDGLWLDANGNPLGNRGTLTERSAGQTTGRSKSR